MLAILKPQNPEHAVINASQNIKGFFYAGEPKSFRFRHSQLRNTGRCALPGPNAHATKRLRINEWYATIIE